MKTCKDCSFWYDSKFFHRVGAALSKRLFFLFSWFFIILIINQFKAYFKLDLTSLTHFYKPFRYLYPFDWTSIVSLAYNVRYECVLPRMTVFKHIATIFLLLDAKIQSIVQLNAVVTDASVKVVARRNNFKVFSQREIPI